MKLKDDMEMNKKKRIERFYFDRFLELTDLPIESVEEVEEPDFLCIFKGESLGVELTTLKKKNFSEICGIQKKIVQSAKKLAEKDLPAIEVTVWFSSMYKQYDLSHKNEAIAYIYKCIKDQITNIQRNDGFSTKIKLETDQYGIHQIIAHWNSVEGKKWLESHRWKTAEPGFVRSNFHIELQELINKKNLKYNNYLKKCDKCWLIVTIDRSNRDEMFRYNDEMNDVVYKSCFNAIYFFDLLQSKYYELKIDMKFIEQEG